MSITVKEFEALTLDEQIAAINALAEEMGLEVGEVPEGADLIKLYSDGLEALKVKRAEEAAAAKAEAKAEKLITFTKTVRFADGKDGKKKFFMKKGETLPESEVTAATRKALKADGHIE